ncbi:MAG: hypothetical protein KGR26_00145 [Cyanobacteria bacterium REEB65]|nr:hypothetical protein [Cyanobacteria bacterium REEB65]
MLSRHVCKACACSLGATAALILATPAWALPGLDLDADLYGGLKTGGPTSLGAGNLDLDLYAGAPMFKASVHAFGMGEQAGVAEGVLRWEIGLPFVSIRPGIGYQANTLFASLATSSLSPGAIDSAPYGNLWIAINPPAIPLSFDAAAGVSYPIGLRAPVVDYLADVNFFPVPVVPVGLSARYRGYAALTGALAAVSAVELGLRVNL